MRLDNPNSLVVRDVADSQLRDAGEMMSKFWVCVFILGSLACSETADPGDEAYFEYIAAGGKVAVVADYQGFECIYDIPSCVVGTQRQSVRVQTTNHIEELQVLGSRAAITEYNYVHIPDLEICDLPDGSLHLGQFFDDPGPGGAEEVSDDVIVVNNKLQPLRRTSLRLSPSSIRASQYAKQARDFMLDSIDRCERIGGPSLQL